MFRSAVSKVMWVGRATVFMVGLAVLLALVFGVVSTAFGANGDFFTLGEKNVASSTTTLVKRGLGPALSLQPDDGPPLKTNSRIKVTNLNADRVDFVSLDCPGGTLFHEGVCIEQTVRAGSSNFSDAQTDCLNEPGTRLPTPGELQTLEGRSQTEWSNHLYHDQSDTGISARAIAVESDGFPQPTSIGATHPYRCIKLPG